MKKFKLKSLIVKSEDIWMVDKKCIEVYNASDLLLCIISGDRMISPQAFEFTPKELKYFIHIAKNFHTTFENLELIAQKDEEIQSLTAIVKQQETEMSFMINNSHINQA